MDATAVGRSCPLVGNISRSAVRFYPVLSLLARRSPPGPLQWGEVSPRWSLGVCPGASVAWRCGARLGSDRWRWALSESLPVSRIDCGGLSQAVPNSQLSPYLREEPRRRPAFFGP
ncbi:hypothetical protein SRHO_G00213940 [Serrasalmus rhombeus]